MVKEKLEEALLTKVHEKLCGHIEIPMNQKHYDCLQRETGISVRKLKELFGIYKRRSAKSYDYTMSMLAQFIGFSDWNSFVRQQMIMENYGLNKPKKMEETIQIKKGVNVDPNKDNKIVISVYVKARKG